MLELLDRVGKMHLTCHYGVEPPADDLPDALEDPGGFVHEADAKGLGVVCFEAFNHKLHGRVILSCVSCASRDRAYRVLGVPCWP